MVAVDERLSFSTLKAQLVLNPDAFRAIWFDANERVLYYLKDTGGGGYVLGTASPHQYKFRATQAAVAAQTSAVAWFPTAPGQVLDRIEVFVSVASAVKITVAESITVASWTALAPAAGNDMNQEGPVAPAAKVLSLSPFAPQALTVRRHPSLAINTPWLVDSLNVLSKGNQTSAATTAVAVVVASEGVNLVLDVNFEWREYL